MSTLSESASAGRAFGHRVDPLRAIGLRPRQDSELRITDGRAWVTLDRPSGCGQAPGDLVLSAGQSLRVPAGHHVVMEPWVRGEALRFDWVPCETASVRTARFAREVVQPARELLRSLRQALVASARLLRGLLGYAECLVAGRGRVLSGFESNPP